MKHSDMQDATLAVNDVSGNVPEQVLASNEDHARDGQTEQKVRHLARGSPGRHRSPMPLRQH